LLLGLEGIRSLAPSFHGRTRKGKEQPLPKSRLALLAALAAIAPAARAAEVWTASATEKIRPAATARAAADARLSAARNEFEAFQVVVTGAAANVRAVASDLVGPGKLPPVRLFRAALIGCAQASALDTSAGQWPDALVPDVDEVYGERRNAFPFGVPAGESRAIWAEVFVPANATPGDYSGTVTVSWDGGSRQVPVTVTVWPFTLPATASLKSAFGFSWGALPQEHAVSGDAFSALRAAYGRVALDHRITLSHIDDGFGSLDHYATFYGAQIDGTAATTLQGARLTAVELMGSASSWSPFFEGKGWSDRLFQYTCDEPPITCQWSDIPARASAARAASPAIRTLVTTTLQEAQQHGVLGSIDILVPVINYLDDKEGSFAGEQRRKYDAWLAADAKRELWTYQSCMSHGCGGTVAFGDPTAADVYFTGWPSYTIDTSAVRNRAMEWLSYRYGLTGELYYESVQGYGQNPWAQQAGFGGNGDGTFFYPGQTSRIGGTKDIPVTSIRLKMIREGMEDYEYLKLLSDLGGEVEAQAIAKALFPRAFQTEVAPADLMAARARLASAIVARAGGATLPAPDAPGAGEAGPAAAEDAIAAIGAGAGGGCGSTGGFGVSALIGAAVTLGLRVRRRAP
jgi:hypothetical protein